MPQKFINSDSGRNFACLSSTDGQLLGGTTSCIIFYCGASFHDKNHILILQLLDIKEMTKECQLESFTTS